MRSMRRNRTKFLSVALVVSAVGLAGSVNASPVLQIVDGTGVQRTIGSFPSVPSADPAGNGGMTIGHAEAGVGNIPLDTQGYASSYLYLSDPSNVGGNDWVTFTLLGDGDSSFNNQFTFSYFGGGTTTWTLHITPNGTSQTVLIPTNTLLDFSYLSGNGQCAGNSPVGTCPNNYNPLAANFFMGALPGINEGNFSYIGLSDAGATNDTCGNIAGDCDFQDMTIGVTVPEPGSIFLVAVGLFGLGLVFGSRGQRKAYAA